METHAQIGRVSSASVRKATGKGWDEWIAILEKAGARTMTHQEIAAFLKKRFKLRPWWQQGVTLGFEIATGRRVEGQNAKGEYSLTATKSLAVDVKQAWRVLVSEPGLAAWLKPLFEISVKAGQEFETEDGFFGEIRTLKKERRIRLSWRDPEWQKPTYVQVTLVPRPKGRSILVFDQGQIRDPRVQARLRKRWKDSLEALSSLMAGA